MPSLKMLDSLIAMVGVILILSLIVQSLQSALKKLLKIKSRQIEDSLVDLFENMLGSSGTRASVTASSPLLRMLTGKAATFQASEPVKDLFNAVSDKFRDIGRVAQSGTWILDSLSKEDLQKVLARVAPDTLLPGFVAKLESVCAEVEGLKTTLYAIEGGTLSGQASAKLAELRQAIDPLIHDVATIYMSAPGSSTAGSAAVKQIAPALLVGDAMRLREIKLKDALGVLGDLQKQMDQDLAAAQASGGAAGQQDLKTASDALKKVAAQLTDLNSNFDSAIAPLRNRLQSVETWFDTVMQSFSERYARGMKTWAVLLSLIVVVLLNANFFKIAHQILTADPVTLAQKVQVVQALKSGTRTSNGGGASGSPNGATTDDLERIWAQTQKDIQQELSSSDALGLGPLLWQQSHASIFPASPLETLAGWAVMTLLLSVGAPFWEDTLESLFGVKNLLRKNTATKNVEQGSGEGNPKAS